MKYTQELDRHRFYIFADKGTKIPIFVSVPKSWSIEPKNEGNEGDAGFRVTSPDGSSSISTSFMTSKPDFVKEYKYYQKEMLKTSLSISLDIIDNLEQKQERLFIEVFTFPRKIGGKFLHPLCLATTEIDGQKMFINHVVLESDEANLLVSNTAFCPVNYKDREQEILLILSSIRIGR